MPLNVTYCRASRYFQAGPLCVCVCLFSLSVVVLVFFCYVRVFLLCFFFFLGSLPSTKLRVSVTFGCTCLGVMRVVYVTGDL